MSEAEKITHVLVGEWRNNRGHAPFPICQVERRKNQRSLSLKDAAERTLMTCHKSGCRVVDILLPLKAHGHGIITERSGTEIDAERDKARRKAQITLRLCDDIFAQTVSIDGTLGAIYLERRGIFGLHGHKVINTLRFHPRLYHSPSKQNLTTLIARIRGPKGNTMGLHRTFLSSDSSEKANVSSNNMMLGTVSGGAVRFGPDQQVVAIAEGIETALSISRASRLTVWATLLTSGMKSLVLPPAPIAEVVVICADRDDAGLAAAKITAERLETEGRAVSLISPQAEGADFNDILRQDNP